MEKVTIMMYCFIAIIITKLIIAIIKVSLIIVTKTIIVISIIAVIINSSVIVIIKTIIITVTTINSVNFNVIKKLKASYFNQADFIKVPFRNLGVTRDFETIDFRSGHFLLNSVTID